MGVKSSGLVKINQQAGVGAQDILEGLGWRRIDAQIMKQGILLSFNMIIYGNNSD